MALQIAPVPPVPVDSAVAAEPIAEDRVSHRWSAATRTAFRLAFCYIAAWCLFNGNATVWEALPVVGDKIQDVVARVFLLPAQFLAQHLFFVAPPGDRIHSTGSGDTAIQWIAELILGVSALLATVVWSTLDRRRPHYQTLAAWLRFLVRMTLGFGMVTYGFVKIIPMQMPAPSIATLSEPLGMHSPMAMLWTFIGLNPWYETVCGAAEFLAGMLLLFRRTALAGALFTAFVTANVVLYNMFFDVPVKLYSVHLLLLAVFLVLPDAKALLRFFWLHQPAAPTGVWVPPASRAGFRRATIGIEIGFALLTIGITAFQSIPDWMKQRAEARLPCELCSDWRIDSAILANGTAVALGGAEGPPAELVINSLGRAVFRDRSGKPTYMPAKTNPAAHTIELQLPDQPKTLYAFTQHGSAHLVLEPAPGVKPPPGRSADALTLSLTRLTPPEGYPLLHRGFHWISEYPYQR